MRQQRRRCVFSERRLRWRGSAGRPHRSRFDQHPSPGERVNSGFCDLRYSAFDIRPDSPNSLVMGVYILDWRGRVRFASRQMMLIWDTGTDYCRRCFGRMSSGYLPRENRSVTSSWWVSTTYRRPPFEDSSGLHLSPPLSMCKRE
jgi:hypothetical protein